jgi:crotonobetainyl-CoA:carnitine CoA-transferase CaiB-like acyl-CoA transferase
LTQVCSTQVAVSTEAAAPYGDLTVVELGEAIAPAYLGKQLADLGATVIRVDDPSGRGLYGFPPIVGADADGRQVGGAYLHLCRNKQSVALDLTSERAKRTLRQLISQAQVVIDGLGVDRLQHMGVSHQELRAAQPDLVVTSITPFGLTGPYRDLAASDLVVMALGGMLNLVGSPEREPLLLGGYQAQYATGICAFTGTAAALLYRDRVGRGQLVDVSALESIAFLEWKSASNYEATGSVRRRTGDRSHNLVMRTRDGWFGLLYTDPNWPQVCELTGVAALQDERFSTRAARVEHSDEIRGLVSDWFAQRTNQEIYHAAQALKVPAGMVTSVADLLESPQYAARGFWQTVDHPATGPLRYPGLGYSISGYSPPTERAPVLGERATARATAAASATPERR